MIWILLVIVWLVWSIPLAVWIGKSISFGMGTHPNSVQVRWIGTEQNGRVGEANPEDV